MSIESLAADWGSAMWRACWQGSLVIGLVWLICRLLLRRARPSTRAALWWLACLKPVVAIAVGASIALPVLAPESRTFADVQDRLGIFAFAPPTTSQPKTSTHKLATVRRERAADSQSRPDWMLGVMGLWLIGSASVGIWMLRQGWRIRSMLQGATLVADSPLSEEARRMGALLGLDAAPRVVESDRVTAPLVVGLWRSTVILPPGFSAQLSEAEAHMALAHELAHVRRRDMMAGLLPTLCQLFFFFLPPMWLALREWSLEREAACDAEALEATQGTPSGYGQMLMKIVSRDYQGGLAPALGATTSYHTLRKRLLMIQRFAHPGPGTRALALLLFGMCLLFAMPWQVTARGVASEQNPNNLVKNSSFEQGDDGLGEWTAGSLPPAADTGVDASVDRSTGHTGKASLKFEKTRVSFFPVDLYSQELRFDPSQKKIKVGMWVKAKDARKVTMALFFVGQETKIEWGAYVGEANAGDSAANHDWKHYGAVLAIPSGTTSMTVALEMYGPGIVWIDDVSAEYVPDSTPLKSAVDSKPDNGDEDPLADVKDVPNLDLKAGHDPMKRYFQIGPKPGAGATAYKLLLVLPGGDGSADFNPFVRRIWKFALPEDYIVAELVAPKWSDTQFEQIVWPTRRVQFKGMRFATEDFVEAVVKDVSKTYKIDPSKVFTLSWSSGGPAAYATALAAGSVKGSFVAMSVFNPNALPPLVEAQGQAFYLLQSPDDKVVSMAHAQLAADELKKAGATTKLVTYPGGHGWSGDVYGNIRNGVLWLEKPTG